MVGVTPHLSRIDFNEVLHYLGYTNGDVPSELEQTIKLCSKLVIDTAQPKILYRILDLNCKDFTASGIAFKGEDIKQHIKGCSQVVLLTATLGLEIDTLIRRTEITDMSKALVLDCCASSAIENVCNNFEDELRELCKVEGLFLTGRYSPGYGDMPIAQTKDICNLLETNRKIGLTITKEGIMIPRKSVTAVLGISNGITSVYYSGCLHCDMMRTCKIRQSGGVCRNFYGF